MTRKRRPPPRGHGLISTADDSFEATLVLDGAYTPTPPSASPHSLVSLIPTTQAIDAMSTTRSQQQRNTQRNTQPQTKHSGSEHSGDSEDSADEQEKLDAKKSLRKKEVEADDLTLDSDNDAHKPAAAAAATPAASAKPRKQKTSTRLGKWNDEQDLQLCTAVLAYVKAHQGQLPGAARTHKKEAAPASWKEIAAATPHCASIADSNAAARAASSRWTSLRAGVAVRHNKHTQADEQRTLNV
jgi:hypothetical protein